MDHSGHSVFENANIETNVEVSGADTFLWKGKPLQPRASDSLQRGIHQMQKKKFT